MADAHTNALPLEESLSTHIITPSQILKLGNIKIYALHSDIPKQTYNQSIFSKILFVFSGATTIIKQQTIDSFFDELRDHNAIILRASMHASARAHEIPYYINQITGNPETGRLTSYMPTVLAKTNSKWKCSSDKKNFTERCGNVYEDLITFSNTLQLSYPERETANIPKFNLSGDSLMKSTEIFWPDKNYTNRWRVEKRASLSFKIESTEVKNKIIEETYRINFETDRIIPRND